MHCYTHVHRWSEMDATTAHDVFRLRQQVFVVEQGDPYDDLDGRDTEPGTVHVVMVDDDEQVVGVARGLRPGVPRRVDPAPAHAQARDRPRNEVGDDGLRVERARG